MRSLASTNARERGCSFCDIEETGLTLAIYFG